MSEIKQLIASLPVAMMDVNKESLETIKESFRGLISQSNKITREHTILHSLQFSMMFARESSIAEAHRKTLDWIFKHPSNILSWMKSPEIGGIFWVSGKPGSGKSTLMKYLSNHFETLSALQAWSGKSQLCIARFYFWNSGTELQKTQEGLLRLLLFQILTQHPELIPATCAGRWKDQRGEILRSSHWTTMELSQCLKDLKRFLNDSPEPAPFKFCFFIDGLDEFKGNHQELIGVLDEIAASAHIKLCVSSRPWLPFEDAYGLDKQRKLSMQDLTARDIEAYSRDKLASSIPASLSTSPLGKKHYEEIINEITARADGVFLWVVLVVQSLLEGVRNCDSMRTLQRRLLELPTDLDEFFAHIIKSVDTVYHSLMADTFRVTLLADSPLPLIFYGFFEDDYENPAYWFEQPIGPLSWDEIEAREALVERQLKGRYKGLLEAVQSRQSRLRQVHFLHRTVRDFLLTGTASDLLAKYGPEKSSSHTICKAITMFLKTYPDLDLWPRIFKSFATYAKIYETDTKSSDFVMMTQLEKVLEQRNVKELWSGRTDLKMDFLSSAIGYRLSHYAESRVFREPSIVKRNGDLYLSAALDSSWLANDDLSCVVSAFLKAGADPNMRRKESTIFGCYMAWRNTVANNEHARNVWVHCVRLMLQHGANPNEKYGSLENKSPTIFVHFLAQSFAQVGVQSHEDENIEITTELLHGLLLNGAVAEDAFCPKNNGCWFEQCLNTLNGTGFRSKTWIAHIPKLLGLFVQFGLKPNHAWQNITVWEALLPHIYERLKGMEEGWCELVEVFLKHGADLNINYVSERPKRKVLSIPDLIDCCSHGGVKYRLQTAISAATQMRQPKSSNGYKRPRKKRQC